MELKDLSELLDPDLYLPIRGKKYRIPAPNADEGLRLRQLFLQGANFSDRGEIREVMTLFGASWVPNVVEVPVTDDDDNPVLDKDGKLVTTQYDEGHYEGGVYSEMVADGLSWREVMVAGRTALFNTGLGELQAEIYWQSQGGTAEGNPLPPEPGANRATRRVAAKKAAPKKATTKKASGGRTRASHAPTATATPAAEPTTPQQD